MTTTATSNELRFEADQSADQRVTVFDSGAVPEPFMNTHLLEAIRDARKAEPKS